ncbi:sugar-transfer associated ATP-grasp domain-containing protein [Thioclava sp. JM3]|uniref:sugar-transfer associated ATP-grasp domain-containing protein n=2 Tax=Thioclava TaxID=285107 RepID=UPI001438E03D|nr:sugar-transfer associated ATP-grasp domain-containing protein [Thioclava sp. JM3]
MPKFAAFLHRIKFNERSMIVSLGAAMSLATLDQTAYQSARDSSFQNLLVYAAKKSGRSVLQVLRDYRQLARSETRINLVEYVRFGLYDDRPGLMGMELPFWKELLEINERAARSFAPVRYQSTDIAITADGPVVVEINAGGGFDLPQYSNGRGMLTPEVRAFFESCGVKFRPKKSLLPF